VSSGELAEHLSYVTDQAKLAAYQSALREVVGPDSVVLDLGAGTGLLGLIAAQCGARKIYSVDAGPILRLAEQAAARSGFGERIVHLRGLSTELTLPEPVDVVVCDQIGGFVHDAGILGYYRDVVERLLKPGGVLVPSEFDVRLTAVADPALAALVGDWRRSPAGLDLSAFVEPAVNTEHHVRASAECALSADVPLATISSDNNRYFGGNVEILIERAGEMCGLLGTFVATMSPNVTMTNAPWAERPMDRWQNFYPFETTTMVSPGDTVRASMQVSPRTGMVAWTGEVVRVDGEVGEKFSHDTLSGMFAGPDAVVRASDAWVPLLSPRAPLAAEVIALIDGRRSIAEISTWLRQHHPDEFVSDTHARSFVRSVVGPVADR